MARSLAGLFGAACLIYHVAAEQSAQGIVESTVFLQVALQTEQVKPKSRADKEARALASRKVVKISKEAKAELKKNRKATSKNVRKVTEMMLRRVGFPDMVASVVAGFLHDSVMDLRKTSAGRLEFIDDLAARIGNMTEDQVTLSSFLDAVHEAGEHSHLENRMKDFIREMDTLLRPMDGKSDPSPAVMFRVMAKGFDSLGMPKDFANIMEEMADVFTNGDDIRPEKLFSMITALYRKMGMPESTISVMEEFGQMLVSLTNNTDTAEANPEVVFGLLANMMKKLGMPQPMLDFCNDLGKLVANSSMVQASPEMLMGFMNKALTSMGEQRRLAANAPARMTPVGSENSHSLNVSKMLAKVNMAKLPSMKSVTVVDSTSVSLFHAAMSRIFEGAKDLEQDGVTNPQTVLAKVVAPATLRLVMAQATNLVRQMRAANIA